MQEVRAVSEVRADRQSDHTLAHANAASVCTACKSNACMDSKIKIYDRQNRDYNLLALLMSDVAL